MNVNHGGTQRLMAEECLDNSEIDTLLIEMCAEGVAKTVRGKALRPAQLPLLEMNVVGNPEGAHRLFRISGISEKIAHRPVVCFPVFRKSIQSRL